MKIISTRPVTPPNFQWYTIPLGVVFSANIRSTSGVWVKIATTYAHKLDAAGTGDSAASTPLWTGFISSETIFEVVYHPNATLTLEP